MEAAKADLRDIQSSLNPDLVLSEFLDRSLPHQPTMSGRKAKKHDAGLSWGPIWGRKAKKCFDSRLTQRILFERSGRMAQSRLSSWSKRRLRRIQRSCRQRTDGNRGWLLFNLEEQSRRDTASGTMLTDRVRHGSEAWLGSKQTIGGNDGGIFMGRQNTAATQASRGTTLGKAHFAR